MHLSRPLLTLALLAGLAAHAADPQPLLSVRPTLFIGSDDVDRGSFTPGLHLGVTGRTQPLAPGLTAELELSADFDANFNLSDNSSYLRFRWQPSGWGEGEGLTLSVLPFHSDRLYLGYAYPLTDLGGAYTFPGGPRPVVTGVELRLTREAGYAFAAVKSTMVLDPLELEFYRQYTVLAGGGASLGRWVRVEAEGSHADLGLAPADANQGIRAPVSQWGAAARLLLHHGSPIGPPTDVARYRNDPARWERLLTPEAYDGRLSSSLSAELLYLRQLGLDGAAFNEHVGQTSVGYALEGRVKWRGLRGFLRGQYRAASLLWTDGPGLPPYKALSANLTSTPGELTATAAADWHFARSGLTPGLSFEAIRPASGEPLPSFGAGSRTVVFGEGNQISVLPQGDAPSLEWLAMATLRWDLGQLSALADAFVRQNPNQTLFQGTAGGTEIVYTSATRVGFDLWLQLRF